MKKTYLDPINNHYVENPDAPDSSWILLPDRPSYSHVWMGTAWAVPPRSASAYKADRAAAYPDPNLFTDAQVKKSSDDDLVKADGVKQEAAYFAACLAVKAKYPKGV